MPVMEAIVRQVVRAVVKPNLHPRVSVATQRKRLDLLRFVPMPHGIRETETTLAGVPAKRLTPSVSTGAILYLHGGAYCIGSPASHKEMVARVARTTEREAFLIDYRLAPEHTYPNAVKDALKAYTALLEEHQDIVIMGDSAGGGLSMALMQEINKTELAHPNALVLFSPWCDLTCSGASLDTHKRRDPMLSPAWLTSSADLYAGATDKKHPGLSPLFGDLSGFPKTLIQVGSEEILLSDAERASAALKSAGSECELQVFDGMWHVFQVHASILKRSRKALYKVAAFINR